MAKTAKIKQTEYEVLAGLRYALRQFLRFSEEVARSTGITPQQHQALLAIKGFPGRNRVTIGELAERLQIRHHSAVGLTDRLVVKGFLARKPAPQGPASGLSDTDSAGRRVLEELTAAHKEQLRRVGPQIESFLKRLRG